MPEDNATVTLDGSSPAFPCHDSGERWNGWVVPAFTHDTIVDVAYWLANAGAEPGDEIISVEGADVFFVTPGGEDGPDERRALIRTADGRFVIDGWCWTLVTSEGMQ